MRSVPTQLLTSTEAGRRLNKSGRTVVRAAESGEIPYAHKLPGPNGAYLFDAAVIDLLAAQSTEASA